MGLISAGPGVISGKIGFKSDRIQKNLLQDLEDFVKLTTRDGKIMDVSKDVVGWERNAERMMQQAAGQGDRHDLPEPQVLPQPLHARGKTDHRGDPAPYLHKKRAGGQGACPDLARPGEDRLPRLRFDNYPYGLSGGMCQRAMIAMALACEPSLLIADEPTTGLDATIQSKIVDLLAELKSELGITTMLISHDISIISRLSDSVAVMYGGTVCEYGPTKEILSTGFESKHPYTSALLASIPSAQNIKEKGYLQAIEGDVLDTINIPAGCRFYSRCNRVTERIREKCAAS